jgi:hypothetical protein
MARILWLPPGLLQSSTRSFTPTYSGHGVPVGVRCSPATTQGPFAPEALPSILAYTGPCAGPVASMPLRPWSRRHWSSPFVPSTAGPPDRPSFDAVASSESVVPSAPGARSVYMVGFFPSDNGLRHRRMARRAPSSPTSDFTWAPIFDAAGIFFDYDPLVHLPSWSLPRIFARRGLCRSSLLGIRFLLPSRASYPVESTNFRGRIRTC